MNVICYIPMLEGQTPEVETWLGDQALSLGRKAPISLRSSRD